MEGNYDFYTVRGYAIHDQEVKSLTPSMEDYLEMIFRLTNTKKYIRVNDLAEALNVKPPSATKMVQKLAKVKCINYEKYGIIELTPFGTQLGQILLLRHNALENFLSLIGVKNNVLEDTEKIEHYLSHESLHFIIQFVEFVRLNPQFLDPFHAYLAEENKYKMLKEEN